jgi:hypothetical protein
MRKRRFPMYLIVIGLMSLLIVGAQITWTASHNVNPYNDEASTGIAQASGIGLPTAFVPPADPSGQQGKPGAPTNNLAVDETGTYRPAPGALLDSDIAWTVETGIPAITPSNGGISSNDVEQYHYLNYSPNSDPASSAPNLFGAAGYSSNIPTRILSIRRLTASQITARDNTLQFNLPGTTPLYFAEYTGEFAQRVPFGVPPMTYPIAFEVFDATTGNLLMWGISPTPLFSSEDAKDTMCKLPVCPSPPPSP